MRRPHLLILLVAAGIAVVVLVLGPWPRAPQEERAGSAHLPPPEAHPAGELTTITDQEAVFKRAFWRRPEADDHIVHAEYLEWSEEGDVSRWQWCIEVEPSKALTDWLKERHPISSVATDAKKVRAGLPAPPEWFPTSTQAYELRQSADGQMCLLFSQERKVLFATASGYGFTKDTPAPVKPMASIAPPGRLPRTPPPKPKQP